MRTLVLLTFNEVAGVRALVTRLLDVGADEIVAVDRNSTDGTREIFIASRIRIVEQERPGRGEAFRAAVRATKGDHLVFFSPDGNEDPRDIPRLFAALESGADLAIASRFLPGSRNEEDDHLLKFRKWANQAFTFAANALWNHGAYVTDTINGFRAVTRDAFGRLFPRSAGYTVEYEMTIRAMKQHMQIVEVATVEGNRIGGVSKGPSLRIGPAFVRLLFQEIFSR